ncbi:MAG TPA: MOSC domain-containing protein [bacterium]|nr:MOSC domain-containing protein [bacterium]
MANGTVVSLHIAPRAAEPTISVPVVRAVPGKGLERDRYHDRTGTYSGGDARPDREVTLIEEEALTALRRDYEIDFDAGESRRNIVTRGVPLNHLVGREFRVGEVRLRGIRLCEPCGHLEQVTGRAVRAGLVHRGGLRAQILTGGTIRIADPIEVIAPE